MRHPSRDVHGGLASSGGSFGARVTHSYVSGRRRDGSIPQAVVPVVGNHQRGRSGLRGRGRGIHAIHRTSGLKACVGS